MIKIEYVLCFFFYAVPQVKKPSRALKVSTGTQTVNNEWVKIFKEELDLDILYGNHIQCRICASISVQAVNIYNKSINQSNNAFFIQDLINSLMPIEVEKYNIYLVTDIILNLFFYR